MDIPPSVYCYYMFIYIVYCIVLYIVLCIYILYIRTITFIDLGDLKYIFLKITDHVRSIKSDKIPVVN